MSKSTTLMENRDVDTVALSSKYLAIGVILDDLISSVLFSTRDNIKAF